MLKVIACILFVSGLVSCQAATISNYLTTEDFSRFRRIFEMPYGDELEEMKYAIYGLQLVNAPISDVQKLCDAVKRNVNPNDLKSLYLAVKIVEMVKKTGKSCDLILGGAQAKFSEAISLDANMSDLLYAIDGLSTLGHPVESHKVIPALEASIKADDSPSNYGGLFFAASKLSDTKEMKKFHDMIEDIVAQADEIDDKYLQFESGLPTTAAVIFSAYKLSAAIKIAPPISEEKIIKFGNYLINRKYTEKRGDAAMLLAALQELSTNQFHNPVAVSLAGPVAVSTESPLVQIHVCNLLGNSLGKLSVLADTARHIGDDAVILSKKSFSQASQEIILFELDIMKVNPRPGFYRVIMTIGSPQSNAKLLGATAAEVVVKVTAKVSVDDVELSVADKDQSAVPKTIKLQYPSKATVEADYHQKLILKFAVRDKISGHTITAHQTFLRLTNLQTKQEVIFVAEQENGDSVYKFDLDVAAKAKDFKNLSGKYAMDLIVGDSVIKNSISWQLAIVQLTFQDDPWTMMPANNVEFATKPDIKHMFREPEKRPSYVMSNFFTGLVLLPILVLFILWIKLGVNMANIPLSLSALGFHIGLAAIFTLYGCYFLHLNMFETLRYLGLIGLPTFLFGHRLLSGIATHRSKLKEVK